MSQEEERPHVLVASVQDVRYFAALLRGINFANRARVDIVPGGLIVTVEESRTLVATSYIWVETFDEFEFHPEANADLPPAQQPRPPRTRKGKKKRKSPKQREGRRDANGLFLSETESESAESEDGADDRDSDWRDSQDAPAADEPQGNADSGTVSFEIPLNTLIECLNIFGSAGPSTTGTSSNGRKGGRIQRRNQEGSDSEENEGRRGTLDAYFTTGPTHKATVQPLLRRGPVIESAHRQEDVAGPTTTCEITTFDPEPQLQLDFDPSDVLLRIILKSSWLREALSEIDASCDRLTFICNPPVDDDSMDIDDNRRQRNQIPAEPIFRIMATGTVGTTEMDYPNDKEVLETFECFQPVKLSYRFAHISRTVRGLASSTKCSLRINPDGLLSIQFILPSPKIATQGGKDAFIEFRFLPLDEDV